MVKPPRCTVVATMRNERNDPTIGVSCGHRVPRVPVKSPAWRGSRYWCEECGEHRMSGGRSTGERGFDFLLELGDEISTRRLEVRLPPAPPAHVLELMRALGASVVEDARLKRPASWVRADRSRRAA